MKGTTTLSFPKKKKDHNNLLYPHISHQKILQISCHLLYFHELNERQFKIPSWRYFTVGDTSVAVDSDISQLVSRFVSERNCSHKLCVTTHRTYHNLATCADCPEILGASASWIRKCLFRDCFCTSHIRYIYIYIYISYMASSSSSSVICQTTGPKPLPKRFLHTVRSRASSFNWQYPLLSLRSSSSIYRVRHLTLPILKVG